MDSERDTTPVDATDAEPSDTEPSELWWFISCMWTLMFAFVMVLILLAEYTRRAGSA